MSPRPRHPSALIRSLARISEENPVGPKLLVGSSFGEGSELLRALALDAGGWVGFQVTTTGRLAARIAAPGMAERRLRSLDRFQEAALVDTILDEVLAGGEWPRLQVVSEGAGFREAVWEATASLRMAEVTPEALEASLPDSERAGLLALVLRSLRERLDEEGLADPARVLALALERLEEAPDALKGEQILLVPGLTTDGRVGRFVAALRARGAEVLTADGVEGISPPPGLLWEAGPVTGVGGFLFAPERSRGGGGLDIRLFRAASVREELREVLRRVVELDLPWDEVEIATPDLEVYGPALDGLCAELGIPASFGMGLPIGRTRPGRAIEGYLRWIDAGYPSEGVRTLLEAGDLGASADFSDVRPRGMARRLRELTVGWGRDRYATAIARGGRRLDREEERDPFDSESRRSARDRQRRELRALAELFEHLDAVTPWTPDPFLGETGSVSAGELADGVLGFLERVPEGEGGDEVARRDLQERLQRLSASLRRRTSFEAALATLRKHLRIRVRAAWDEGAPPWKSSGGHVHLTDLAHGGLTGRRATFVVGLDAGRFPGPGRQDPMLLDEERRLLDADLHSSVHALHARRFQLAVLASRVRGTLTLSYTAWDSREGRTLQPAPVLLDAFRLARGNAEASFEDLDRDVGPPVSPLPRGGTFLDGQDVWLAAAAKGASLALPLTAVRRVFERLGRGLDAREQMDRPVAGPFRGRVQPRPEELDPRKNPKIVLSAGRLEALGTCPLRYFYRYVLGVRAPEETVREPDAWLDALSRGALLHQVFEELMAEFPDGSQAGAEDALLERGLEILRARAEELRDERPAPSKAVYRRELGRLGADLRSFARAAAEDGVPWVALELGFGWGDDEAVPVNLPGGVVRMMGKVDRIDRLAEGLRIVDYKTGSRWGFGGDAGPYNGGRRLQHVLYSEVVETLLKQDVVRFEYHFPTPRGLNEVEGFDRDELRPGLALVDRLMDLAEAGHFLPTEEQKDCTFCDYAPICRVKDGTSPVAAWGEENLALVPEYEELRDVRTFQEGS